MRSIRAAQFCSGVKVPLELQKFNKQELDHFFNLCETVNENGQRLKFDRPVEDQEDY